MDNIRDIIRQELSTFFGKSDASVPSQPVHQLSLEELFAEANRYGIIRVHQYERDKEWKAMIEMFTTMQGASARAESDNNHHTVREALELALERAKAMTRS